MEGKQYGIFRKFSTILNNYEGRVDIESKVVNMIDRVHSATTFIKYQSEGIVDMDDPRIIPILRNNPLVVSGINEGKDLTLILISFDVFFCRKIAASLRVLNG